MSDEVAADDVDLAEAAEAVAAELRRFEELATALGRERLNSEKNVKRAAQRLQQLADCDARLAARVQTLVASIAAARAQQERQARAVEARAQEIRARGDALLALRARGEALHTQAIQVNSRAQQVLEAQNGGTDAHSQLDAALADICADIDALAAGAQALVQAAEQDDFPDVARDAGGLHAQMTATRNKLDLLRRRLR